MGVIPDDRAVLTATRKLKQYAAYKGRQTQSSIERDQALDADLQTVEVWAQDAEDNGIAWADRRNQTTERDERIARQWQDAVQRDEQQAEQEAEQRRRFTPAQIKDELNKRIDEHGAAVAALAEAKEPGFRGKLSEVRRESLQAKKFLDEKFESSLEDSAKRVAAQRAQRRVVAEKFSARARAAQDVRQRYMQDPDSYAEGQRADVASGLQRIRAVANARSEELAILGGDAIAHRSALEAVSSWADELAGQLEGSGTSLVAAKTAALARLSEMRDTFAALDAFDAQLERESNEHFATFRTWTQQNTERARRWINSDSDKHRRWAAAWLGKTEERGA